MQAVLLDQEPHGRDCSLGPKLLLLHPMGVAPMRAVLVVVVGVGEVVVVVVRRGPGPSPTGPSMPC